MICSALNDHGCGRSRSKWHMTPSKQNLHKAECAVEGRVLRRVDPSKPLILYTDWSVIGIGAILGQADDDGHEYMCLCISRSLNVHERNYPAFKGELLAVVYACNTLRCYLHGVRFKIVTDHSVLQ